MKNFREFMKDKKINAISNQTEIFNANFRPDGGILRKSLGLRTFSNMFKQSLRAEILEKERRL